MIKCRFSAKSNISCENMKRLKLNKKYKGKLFLPFLSDLFALDCIIVQKYFKFVTFVLKKE